DRVDVLFTQPVGEPGPGEDAGVLLAEPPCRPGLVGGDAGMVGGGGGPGGKYRGVGGKLVLNDHHGDLGALGGLDRVPDMGDGFLTGRVLDREESVEVFLLGVDDDQGSVWGGHVVLRSGVRSCREVSVVWEAVVVGDQFDPPLLEGGRVASADE